MKNLVSIVHCENYEQNEVYFSLRRAIELIGGIENFVKRGDRVLLKPNLRYGKSPETAVTTHPMIVRAAIDLVREVGGIPFIGDSPALGNAARAAEKAGLAAVAREARCPIVDFESPVALPTDGMRFFRQLEVDRNVLDADVIINLPKFKTHTMMLLTLGVKNLFGCIPGRKKALCHLMAGDDHKLFARLLVDLYLTIRPSLTVLDGVIGMDGNGPGSGRPAALKLLLASNDALSLDQIVCDLIGIPRDLLPTNFVAFEQGIGLDNIEVVGESIETSKISGFQLPRLQGISWDLPRFLRTFLKNALSPKPVVDHGRCGHCDRCLQICPASALERTEKGISFDYGRCIRCYCCQEVCPEAAIVIRAGWGQRAIDFFISNFRSTRSRKQLAS